jgi:very-short-patch-repair endonuclease
VQTSIKTRDRARSLRKRLTKTELWLWLRIRGDPVARFRNQHPIGPYILDFYCPAAKLAVELDGGVHEDEAQQIHDAIRTAWLRENGVQVLRIAVKDFLTDPDGIAQQVLATAHKQTRTP